MFFFSLPKLGTHQVVGFKFHSCQPWAWWLDVRDCEDQAQEDKEFSKWEKQRNAELGPLKRNISP